jgi:hypothetical protein
MIYWVNYLDCFGLESVRTLVDWSANPYCLVGLNVEFFFSFFFFSIFSNILVSRVGISDFCLFYAYYYG